MEPRKENKKRADRQKPTGAWKGSRAGEEGTRGGEGANARRRDECARRLLCTSHASRVGWGKEKRLETSNHRIVSMMRGC